MKDVLVVKKSKAFQGEIDVPGDKSISHRAFILASIAKGTSVIRGAQKGKDCLSTLGCMRKLGVEIEEEDESFVVKGAGFGGLREPSDVLDCQNSGTTMRIISGVLAAQNFYSVLTGDSSLRRRPMQRIIEPLSQMGAKIWSRKGGYPPLSIKGGSLRGIRYILPVASAQVKSSILLASLHAEGETELEEPHLSRNHTEIMLKYMGAKIRIKGKKIQISGPQELEAREFKIPGDISSAAFFIGGASILEGSCVMVNNVGVNPTRAAFLKILQKMGAQIEVKNERIECGEKVADVQVRGTGHLKGVKISGDVIPQVIDEVPILAVVACFAEGETIIEGARELRVKETDRIKALVTELSKMGACIKEMEDGMIIKGGGKLKGAEVESWEDHRIAMALAIGGACAKGETKIKNASCINISFPGFQDTLEKVAIY